MVGAECVASWPLAEGKCDLALVDALAHLQLSARRNGWTIRLRDVDEDLRELLELVGLADVLSLEPRW
jgi:ABC-type transporter Mla MlaB component